MAPRPHTPAAGGRRSRLHPLSTVVAAVLPAALLAVLLALAPAAAAAAQPAATPGAAVSDATAEATVAALVAAHGEAERDRIERGVAQVRSLWRAEDGDGDAFRAFVEAEFVPRGEALDRTFDRFEFALERIGGYLTSLVRDLGRGADLEIGPMLPLDERLAAWSPGAHVADDLYANKIAFVALLNFPLTTLEEKLAEGGDWSRREWAETRLAGQFDSRVPAAVSQRIGAAMSAADSYINGYNVFLHHLLDEDGDRLFPAGLRLISHWGLRDELKARYADPEPALGLERQRMIQRVFERIVRQEIPAAVIDDPRYDWNPYSNRVTPAAEVPAGELEAAGLAAGAPAATGDLSAREPDRRYAHWKSVFEAQASADPYSPRNPTFVDRRFDVDREIPEEEVEALLVSVLSSPLAGPVGELVAERLGRPLEPFDVWYVGFKPRGAHSEESLDEITEARYPSADAFAEDIPRILTDLGFDPERARFVADHVVVEPSRGAGHAFGAARRDDNAHLRTRVGPDGMDYKGYNIAVHELGHNVEQVFGVTEIDHTLLQGVPNTAFTEALAFTFQNRDLELLGLEGAGSGAEALAALDAFWSTREIAGVGLVDMRVWRWLYYHPEATPAELREAVVEIAQGVWNDYFAPVMCEEQDCGERDQVLLAVYSHMIDGAMYTPDYPLGHLIAFQVEEYFESSDRAFGDEFERVAKIGRVTPDAWMRQAVGGPLSAQPLLDATREALGELGVEGGEGGGETGGDSASAAAVASLGGEPGVAVESGEVPSDDRTTVPYVAAGPRVGDSPHPAVVLIHCWGCDHTYWNPVLPALAAERRVVAVDLPGHGAAAAGTREEWTMEAYGADVAAVVEALELPRVVLVGHSMGGYVMLEAAERLPGKVAGMVAVDTLLDVEQVTDPDAAAAYLAALRRDYPGTVGAMVRQYLPPGTDPAVGEAVRGTMGGLDPEIGIALIEELMAYDEAATLDELGLPWRAVNGSLLPTDEDANRRHGVGYEAVYVEGSGHWPMLEHPAAFERALLAAVESYE